MPPPPLYFDWHFWSAVIALLALILTQVPPLRVLLRRVRLDVESFPSFAVGHELGNPRAQMHVLLTNTGGRDVQVRRIWLEVSRGDADRFLIPALGYFQKPADPDTV